MANSRTWVEYERRNFHHLFSPRQPHQKTDNVPGQGAVGIAVVLEVNHHAQLREQDAVHQVRREAPDKKKKLCVSVAQCKKSLNYFAL